MTPKDDLFQLIKSLSKSEKRYFKLYSSFRSGDKIYLQLFDTIEKQNEYNEDVIKKKFKGETFINQLTKTKYYLYNHILKSLRSYGNKMTKERELRELLDNIEVLYEKQLYSHAIKFIEKAEEIAIKYESYSYLFEIVDWKIKIINTRAHIQQNDVIIKKQYESLFEHIHRYKNLSQYRYVISKFNSYHHKYGWGRKETDWKPYEKIMSNIIFDSEDQAPSYKAKVVYYYQKSFYNLMKNDYEKAYINSDHLLKLMETNSHFIEENPISYVRALTNMSMCAIITRRYKEVQTLNDKFNEIRINNISNKNVYGECTIKLLTNMVELGQYKAAIDTINDFNKNNKHGEALNSINTITYYYNCSLAYFGNEDYRTANKYLNKIFYDNFNDTRIDLYCFAQILSLIISFELGKEDLIEYSVKSVYRTLLKRGKLYLFEQVLISFIQKRMVKVVNKTEMIKAFTELKKDLEKLVQSDPFEAKALGYFDIVSWLKSKIEGKTFADVIRKKHLIS